MKAEKILTMHPEKKNGVAIDKSKYEFIRNFILNSLKENDDMTFGELTSRAVSELENQFDGSVPWYIVTVKLDLEARGLINCDRKKSPQKLKLV